VDLPHDFGARVRPELERIRRDIEVLATRFGLERERRSRVRRIQALLVAAAVEVQDAGSQSFRAYGSVEPDLARDLDPLLEDIAEALGAMISALLAGAPNDGGHSDARLQG
jgi:hypothetical protein